MTKALITGIKGFAGSHLAEYLLSKGYQVSGICHNINNMGNLAHIKDRLTLYQGDIRDDTRINQIISKSKPAEIYHLAAIAHIPTSYRDPRLTFDVNLYGTFNLLEAVKTVSRDIKVLYVGSASEYGAIRKEEIPISEDVPLRPVDPYSVSKASADLLAYQYYKSFNLHVVRVRPFNHIGLRQSPDYVVSNFAKQIAEIERGLKDPVIRVGNLEAKRDFTDVRDMVRAYWLALQKGEPGEVYNICSGKAVSIQEVLDKLLKLSKKEIKIEQDVERLRSVDISLLLGNSSRFGEEAAWEPEIHLQKTLKDILNYWCGKT